MTPFTFYLPTDSTVDKKDASTVTIQTTGNETVLAKVRSFAWLMEQNSLLMLHPKEKQRPNV